MLNSATNILPIYYQYFMAMRQRITMSFLDQRYVEYIGDIFVNILTTDGTETADNSVISIILNQGYVDQYISLPLRQNVNQLLNSNINFT